MFKTRKYKNGNFFQISYGDKFGYIQEVGDSLSNGSNYYCKVYKQPFQIPINDVGELSDKEYYIGYFTEQPSKVIKKSFYTNQGDIYRPMQETPLGFEFKYGIKSYLYVRDLGLHPVLRNFEFPNEFRDVEFNFISGTYKWYVTTPKKFVRYQKTVNGIEHLSPFLLGFGRCVDWWQVGLTLETWNDEYCQSVIEKYYLENPKERPIKMSFEEVVATMPTKMWIANEVDVERAKWYIKIEESLHDFIKSLSSSGKIAIGEAKKAMKELCVKLNKLQTDKVFIETQEREELYTFISNALRVKKIASAIDILDKYRDW